jgi:LysE type translocator
MAAEPTKPGSLTTRGRRGNGMLGIHEIWLFVLSGVLLNITPGPDSVYVIGRSMQMGWRGGAAAAFGISCGCFFHVAGAAIGLSALLMASSTAFSILKLVGAASRRDRLADAVVAPGAGFGR